MAIHRNYATIGATNEQPNKQRPNRAEAPSPASAAITTVHAIDLLAMDIPKRSGLINT